MTKKDLELEILDCISLCEGRISNGADMDEAFQWLKEDIQEIMKGLHIKE